VLRILVAGGGVGGLAVALSLRQAGFTPVVYEAHPDSGQDIGAFLTLAGNGVFALAQVEADDVVDRAGFALDRMKVVAAGGDELAAVPLHRYRCLRRSELCAVLRAEVRRRGIAVEHGKRLVAIEESGEESDGEVTAHFADGDSASGDLLVGADGLNSALRTLIDPSAAPPRYAGQRVFYGYTTEAAAHGEPGRIDMIRASEAAFGFARSPEGETYWFARVSGDELTAAEVTDTPPVRWRDLLVGLLGRDPTPAADIVAATGDRLMVTNASDLPSVERWRTARTLLIGDAAHAASPATGQGASMAIEDAVVLAKALRDAPMDRALETYERLRRPRVERNVANSARLSAGRVAGRPPPRREGPPPGVPDEELTRQLTWTTPIA
jgi:2-polyprenyl-6-methoxyphenol hydroxylase-like FAD-dependent oxidoreductase